MTSPFMSDPTEVSETLRLFCTTDHAPACVIDTNHTLYVDEDGFVYLDEQPYPLFRGRARVPLYLKDANHRLLAETLAGCPEFDDADTLIVTIELMHPSETITRDNYDYLAQRQRERHSYSLFGTAYVYNNDLNEDSGGHELETWAIIQPYDKSLTHVSGQDYGPYTPPQE